MKVSVTIDEITLDLGVETSTAVIKQLTFLEDSFHPLQQKWTEIQEVLARSASSEIRALVAESERLTEPTFTRLLQDHSPDVIKAAISNPLIGRLESFDLPKCWIEEKDDNFQIFLAERIGIFRESANEYLAKKLSYSASPSTLLALARNDRVPLSILESLSQHADADVAYSAQTTISYLEEENLIEIDTEDFDELVDEEW